jgi:formate--tetrahydrofolate ligase
MAYLSDIEIAQQCEMKPIMEIAKKAHVDEKCVEQYGRYKAKIDPSLIEETDRKPGKLVLVTAITPTPAGEGKTTTTIGLADGLARIGKDVTVALREPASVRFSASRAARPAADMRRWSPWKILTSTSPVTSMQSARRITC